MDSDSDIDFNDVFGGPPRRSLVQETRNSFAEDMDSSAFRSDETVAASMNPLPGLVEKPVFGEEGMMNRRSRRCSRNNDFFDDIFRGNESTSSSPWKYEMKDPFAPGSQLLSPSWPLPPKAEPFGTSFPSQFSLPAKLSKGMDIPTFGSPTHSTSKSKDGTSNGSSYHALSRFSSQANQDKEEVRNDFQGNSKDDSSSSEISKTNSRFHFSIYKWANNGGVPITIPLRGSDRFKEKDKLQRCCANGWIASESIAIEPNAKLHDSFSTTDRMSSSNAKSFRVEQHDKNENGSFINPRNDDDEPEFISWLKSTDKNVPGDTVLPQQKCLNLFFDNDNDDERGNDEITKNGDISEKNAKKLSEDCKNIKKQDVKKRVTSNNVEASKSVKSFPRSSLDNGKGRVRGKVKEFIKIFNQDDSAKHREDIVSETHSSRCKERHTFKPEIEPSISLTERDEKIHMANVQNKKISPDVHVANHMCNGASEKNTHSLAKDTVSDGSETVVEDPAESSEVNFLIQDLTPEEKILPQFVIDLDEIQAMDAKIRQWSNGKQGNIRSLLSTLQYVLWPDSGWKPVALADIIEARTVKRSYQKALLCLHPDKLQQKGTAPEKKYVAKKVFDILQDAWTHFNSLGSV